MSGGGDGRARPAWRTLARRYPGTRGYTRRNLFRMRQLYEAYRGSKKVSALLTQLPWTHHLAILGHTKKREERLFYVAAAPSSRLTREEGQARIRGCVGSPGRRRCARASRSAWWLRCSPRAVNRSARTPRVTTTPVTRVRALGAAPAAAPPVQLEAAPPMGGVRRRAATPVAEAPAAQRAARVVRRQAPAAQRAAPVVRRRALAVEAAATRVWSVWMAAAWSALVRVEPDFSRSFACYPAISCAQDRPHHRPTVPPMPTALTRAR